MFNSRHHMKVIFSFLFVFFAFILISFSGCTNTTNDKIIDDITPIEDARYMTFEEFLNASDVIARCTCIDYEHDKAFDEYTFSVKNIYFGNVYSDVIKVRSYNRVVVLTDYDNLSYKYTDIKYDKEKDYYLVLKDISSPYSGDNLYMSVGGNIYLTSDLVSEYTIYGEPISKHSILGDIIEEKAFEEYLKNQINGFEENNKNVKYIRTSDFYQIIKESPYILHVEAKEEHYKDATIDKGADLDRDLYECIVLDAIRGNVETDSRIYISFPKDTIRQGSEVIVALFESEEGRYSPRSFYFSSKNSLFSLTQKQEIIDLVNGLK